MPQHHTDVVDTRDARTIDRFIAYVLDDKFVATHKPIGWTLRLWLTTQDAVGATGWETNAELKARRLEAGVHRRLEADTELYDRIMAAIHDARPAA